MFLQSNSMFAILVLRAQMLWPVPYFNLVNLLLLCFLDFGTSLYNTMWYWLIAAGDGGRRPRRWIDLEIWQLGGA